MSVLRSDQMFVNLGPQHPSTHGVLRVGLTIEGEVIVKAEPDVGYLHRGTEKLAEFRTWHHGVVYSDRWDYVSAMTNEMAYCLAVEKLMGIEVPARACHVRAAFCELQRVASHLLYFGTYAVDIGAFTPFLHAFREREMVLDLFEMACGARLTYNAIRIGGVLQDLPPGWVERCREFLAYFRPRLKEYDDLLTYNPIFLDRTQRVGIITRRQALDWGLTGPNLRGSGVRQDSRKTDPPGAYDEYDFDVPVGRSGSCWDRYHCRMREMAESAKIVEQALGVLESEKGRGPVTAKVPKVLKAPPGEAYGHFEGSRGDVGVYLVSDGNAAPYRSHVRAPSFLNLQVLQEVLVGQKIADVVAILGSIDIVLGEADR
jgi:NADH-quinone oxidoreductase subunit D